MSNRNQKRKYLLTAGCVYCSRLFTSFNYAIKHMHDSHSRQIKTCRMAYPINYGCDPGLPHKKPIEVWLDQPPGAKGMTLKEVEEASKLEEPEYKHKYGAYQGVRRIDGKDINFASRMEFNYYLYLRWLKQQKEIADFEYQPKPFDFHLRAKERPDLWSKDWLPWKKEYKADFWIKEKNGREYVVETVGKLRRGHTQNFKMLRLLFPEVELRVVGREQYKNIEASVSGLIPEWERGPFKGQRSRFGRSRRKVYLEDLQIAGGR